MISYGFRALILVLCLQPVSPTFALADAPVSKSCPFAQESYQRNLALPEHREGYHSTSGGSMYFRYFNSGPGPLVILAPGLPSCVYFSALIAKLVDAGYNVVSFDFPGKMDSELHRKVSVDFLVSQMDELFSFLQLDSHRDWEMVGTSMGAVVASKFAETHRAHVKSLVLLNPIGMEEKYTLIQKMAFVPILNTIAAPFVMKSQVHDNISGALYCPQNYGALLSEQDEALASVQNRWNYLNLLSNYAMRTHADVYQQLGQVDIPVLIVGGQPGYDRYADEIEQIKPLVPQAEYTTIDRTSHIPFVENPDATFALLRGFYGSHGI